MTELAPPAAAMVAKPSSPARSRRRWWLAILAGALVCASIAAIVWKRVHADAAVRYVTSAATLGPVTRVVSTTGTVNPELTIIVGSYVSGVIKAMYCDYNTRVKTGQVCAKIDPRPYQTTVDQAKANLAVGKAQLQKDQAALPTQR